MALSPFPALLDRRRTASENAAAACLPRGQHAAEEALVVRTIPSNLSSLILYMAILGASACGGGTSILAPGHRDLLFVDTPDVVDGPRELDPGGLRPDGEAVGEDVAPAADMAAEEGDEADTAAGDPGPDDPGPSDPGQPDPGPGDPGPGDTGSVAPYTGVYAGLEDVTGTELARRLCALVTDGYDSVGYSTAGDLIRDEVDNFGGRLEEIYSGIWQNPGGLNMEHTWPQSKGADGIAKSDMYHLYASNPDYNSPRGNLPYGDVTVKDWPDAADEVCNHACTDAFPGRADVGCCSIRGTDGSGQKVFEPRDAHKGNVARAVFYFALRYEGCERPSISAYDGYGASHAAITEAVHKEWNRLDPPDADERARNQRIEVYQRVRNPFIDHPEFADRIDFTP
jgi:endonuclease I